MSLSGGQDFQIIQAQLVAWGFSDPPAIITNSLSLFQCRFMDVHSKMSPGGWMGWCLSERQMGEGTALSSFLAFLDEI